MNYLASWIHSSLAQALGWTLAHFVWEGAALALMLAAGLRLFRYAPARWRYAMAGAILGAMPVAFAVTLAVMRAQQPAATPWHWTPGLAIPVADAGIGPAPRFTVQGILDRLAWLAPFWMLGVVFFYVRGMAGWAAVNRLRRRGVCSLPSEWQARLDELAARLRIARPVVLLESCFTDTPVLIGYLRPVILLPLGCLTGLSAGQVECILLHELAHVRRHDYVLNLMQGLVEGLLFYHPAVWWVSRVVRAERENCCDDAVVELVGDARSYAATLARLEQRRALSPQAALAATGGNLMKRIRRLTLEPRRTQSSAAPAVTAGLLLVLFAACLAALPAKLPIPKRTRSPKSVLMAVPPQPAQKSQARAADLATPYRKWLDEDVAYIIEDGERTAYLKLVTDDERENFIEQFWKRRDPTPDTVQNEFKEEHYRRIAFANEHFASAVAGWKTDRGRIYITYGPPDAIASPDARTIHWTYRFIDGIGNHVVIDLVDSQGNGEFHMTKDPHFAQAAAPQAKLGVSVTVAAATPGVIGVGDVLRVGMLTAQITPPPDSSLVQVDAVILKQKAFIEGLLRRYQPSFPEVLKAQDELRAFEQHRDELEKAQNSGLTYQIQDSQATVLPDGKISVAGAGEIVAAGLTPYQLEAALDSQLGRRPSCRVSIEQSASHTRMVTVNVALEPSGEHFHVFGEVTTLAHRVVQSFDADVNGQATVFAKTVPLRVGIYRLVVVVKNPATGVVQNSESEITVD